MALYRKCAYRICASVQLLRAVGAAITDEHVRAALSPIKVFKRELDLENPAPTDVPLLKIFERFWDSDYSRLELTRRVPLFRALPSSSRIPAVVNQLMQAEIPTRSVPPASGDDDVVELPPPSAMDTTAPPATSSATASSEALLLGPSTSTGVTSRPRYAPGSLMALVMEGVSREGTPVNARKRPSSPTAGTRTSPAQRHRRRSRSVSPRRHGRASRSPSPRRSRSASRGRRDARSRTRSRERRRHRRSKSRTPSRDRHDDRYNERHRRRSRSDDDEDEPRGQREGQRNTRGGRREDRDERRNGDRRDHHDEHNSRDDRRGHGGRRHSPGAEVEASAERVVTVTDRPLYSATVAAPPPPKKDRPERYPDRLEEG